MLCCDGILSTILISEDFKFLDTSVYFNHSWNHVEPDEDVSSLGDTAIHQREQEIIRVSFIVNAGEK